MLRRDKFSVPRAAVRERDWTVLHPSMTPWIALALAASALLGCADRRSATSPLQPVLEPFVVGRINRDPSWSPTGQYIAFVHLPRDIREFARGKTQVWIYDALAETAAYVAPGDAPSWSPGGDSLIHLVGGAVYAYGMHSHVRTLLAALGEVTGARWSPTQPLLALSTDYQSVTGSMSIWLVSLTGGPPRNISTLDRQGAWLEPRFSPDGSQILHERFLQSVLGTELFVMDTSGNYPFRLTNNAYYDEAGSWSPDGAQIAFDRTPASGPGGPDVWIMQVDGANARRIYANAMEPSWSPDGTSLVVCRFTSGGGDMATITPRGSLVKVLGGLP
jgi:Tol biopolymer transport system component